jgi:adenylylsulfate kinase
MHEMGIRNVKESLLSQHACVVWMCGLSGAGKSTLANLLDQELALRGHISHVIDGDVIRNGLNKGLGFSYEDRYENLRRVAEVAKLFTHCGVIAVVSFISPTNSIRKMAKDIIGPDDFHEVFINAPLEICERRDTKGLYKQAREGKLSDFTGIDSPFEPPENPDLVIDTGTHSIEECLQKLLAYVLPRVNYKNSIKEG